MSGLSIYKVSNIDLSLSLSLILLFEIWGLPFAERDAWERVSHDKKEDGEKGGEAGGQGTQKQKVQEGGGSKEKGIKDR